MRSVESPWEIIPAVTFIWWENFELLNENLWIKDIKIIQNSLNSALPLPSYK